jgi:hypothetical protein
LDQGITLEMERPRRKLSEFAAIVAQQLKC